MQCSMEMRKHETKTFLTVALAGFAPLLDRQAALSGRYTFNSCPRTVLIGLRPI